MISTGLRTCATMTPLGLPAWLGTPMRSQSTHSGVNARGSQHTQESMHKRVDARE